MAVASAVILIALGLVTSSLLESALFKERREQVLSDAGLRFSTAQSIFDQSTAKSADQVQESAGNTVENLRTSAAGAGVVAVSLLRSSNSSPDFIINDVVSEKARLNIPQSLRDQVKRKSNAFWQSISIPQDHDAEVPGIIVGYNVTLPRAGTYELYIVYSLENDQRVLDIVISTLSFGLLPIIIILPLAIFAFLIHTMLPVKRTSEAAVKLAEGDLSTRVDVSGSDEMAQLASAFNNMAGSLQRKIEEHDELSLLQERFVSDVSHELRTPMTTIRMAEELIWDDRENFEPATKRSAELLHEQVARFESMLSDLLEISRYDASKVVLETENVDIVAEVKKTIYAHEELAIRAHVLVRLTTSSPRCTCEVDVRRFERIIRNLLTNAVEHAEKKPVDITIASSDTDVAIRVRDYGVGMNEETVVHVFDRFFRADPARPRTTGGTGLGLSITSEDVALHQGLIEAWGELGKGSAFLVTLPKYAGNSVQSHPLEIWEETE